MFADKRKDWGTIIIGGGQAGLAMGYYLRELEEDFVILDGAGRIGDSWRNRWDTLKLVTPNWANEMPGFPAPDPEDAHAGKDEIADYLEDFSIYYKLPILSRSRVSSLVKTEKGYKITCECGVFSCKNVVIANGSYSLPKIPVFSKEIDPKIYQVHSSGYRRLADLPEGDILVAGAGTSGIQIAIDVAGPPKKVYIAGKPTFRVSPFVLRMLGKQLVWVMNHIMTIKTGLGRKAAQSMKVGGGGAPLINTSIGDAKKAGVLPVPVVTGVSGGLPLLADGRTLNVAAVIWCTGYSFDFSWIDIDGITDGYGYPFAYRGISKSHEGLYFMGMGFQYAITSTWINGAGRDAKFIADHIHLNRSAQRSAPVVFLNRNFVNKNE